MCATGRIGEMRFLDYLGEITREDSEPYKWDEVEE